MSKEEIVPDQEAPPCYSLSELMVLMAGKMEETARTLDVDQAARFLDEMLAARRVYVAGAGRSGLVSRAFAMRLMHIGFESYVIGETITPAFSAGDTLVAFSGSGETNSIFDICETAKELGGKLCLITASPDSRIARIADCMVMLGRQEPRGEETSKYEVRQIMGQYRSVSPSFAPLGTLFETAALIFADSVISALIETRHCNLDEVRGRLSNVQ
ncbi:MAG TPA: SIS domain-containing protein [Methanoregulaceae archaeon]|nr:SIS domain-containing protein [Methanoregulaceae archaeon]HPD10887.1 SIS domain-containing protein [Methanoregulaceae archaeon]HRT16032.1 SIS domain-containing protein [Methanoregulaceae archaeon]HRU31538.1 SIS domain-containing protein [Methanoregulaceae archaeon]